MTSYQSITKLIKTKNMEESFDYIIVGGGIIGSATAYELAKRKKKTLLLEQHELGKSQGSSQGKSRLIRHSYVEEFFTQMMIEAYEDWSKIEKENGNTIFKRTGLLTVEKPPIKKLHRISQSLSKFNQPFEYLDSETLKTRFPQLNLPNFEAVYEPDGGLLKPDVALTSIQDLFIKEGGFAKGNSKVINIEHSEDKVTIKTENEEYTSKSLVICAGPWAPDLLKTVELDLPIEPEAVRVLYWKDKDGKTYNSDNFPCVLDETNAYGEMPSFEYPGCVKVLLLMGVPQNADNLIELLSKYIHDTFPGMDSTAPCIEEKCYYTNSPDDLYILDRHPNYKNIVIGTGFSGTAFKLATVVGKILAKLAMDEKQDYDLQPFCISRFRNY